MAQKINHHDLANAIRFLSIDAVQAAKSGHPGLPMGAADVATVLFTQFLKIDPTVPDWADRDRFILSAGHGSMLLYALHYLLGYSDMTLSELKNFRQMGSKTAGHPEYGHALGIETTTGPLGQGLATAVGMAMAERKLNADYGDDIVDHHTYVFASDGDLMEGISQESISLAGHLKLNKLIVLFDDNGISIDGPISISESGDQILRFKAAGWSTQTIDGHDPEAISKAIEKAKKSDKPVLIACKTKIGFGSPNKEGTSGVHGAPLGDEEIAATRAALGWSHEPFEIPNDVLDAWRMAALKNCSDRKAWEKRLDSLDADKKATFERLISGELPQSFASQMQKAREELYEDQKALATRKSSEIVLGHLNEILPETVGGSADLTGSNNTKTADLGIFNSDDYSGRYVHYGIREHAMAAAMNGMALHGGVYPYGGTFLVFSDYCRPSIRLSALMGQRVVYVFTHDSIGLGEDGPTHQPVEHLAALRAIPNVAVFRPADLIETSECWQLASENQTGPSILVLTRQNLPAVRTQSSDDVLTAKGAYAVRENRDAVISIFASGSEVEIALAAADLLEEKDIAARVVSVPCFELFAKQSEGYRQDIIGDASIKVGIEAAIRQGWDQIIGSDGIFIGMDSFGASAPYKELYEHFGITAEQVVAQVTKRLAQ